MATYLVGVKHLANGEKKRYLYLCGPERRLVEELVSLYVRNVDAGVVMRTDLADTPESDVWETMAVFPPGAGRRLVIVRSAELVRDWDRFLDLDYASPANIFICFVSSEPDTDMKPEHMRTILKRGRYVRCGPFTRHADRVTALQLHRGIAQGAADLLLHRTASVSAALGVLEKCSYFSPGQDVPYAVVEKLVPPSPHDDYVGALMALKPALAAEASFGIEPSEYSSVVGMLNFRLTALSRLNSALRRSTDIRDLARITRLDSFVVRDLYGYARLYGRSRQQVASEALQMADVRINEGETDLVLETLAVLWAA